MEWTGRVVIVTGGGQGIGRAIAFAFASGGARVVIADTDDAAGRDAASEIEQRGGEALAVATDVGVESAVQALAGACWDRFGAAHYLINNAGIGAHGTVYDLSTADWDRVLATNLRGPFLCAKHLAPLIRKSGGGAIVNIASTRALMSEPNTEAYAASKGGLLALTHALAVSLGPDRIRVNAISPGWIATDAWQRGSRRREPSLSEADHRQHPVGRVGKPEDIAALCCFLCSDAAGFITGQNFVADGGMTVKMIYV